MAHPQTPPTKDPAMMQVEASELWCMHVLGPDEVHPMPDRATAQRMAAEWTVFWHGRNPEPRLNDPIMSFVVAPWPWSAEKHAEGLARSIANNSFAVSPLALSTPPKPAEEARELLAAEYERDGMFNDARAIRTSLILHTSEKLALRAIEAALSRTAGAEVVDWQGIETAPEDDPFVAGLWVKNNQSGEKCWEAYIVVIDDETGEARSFPDDDPLPWALDDFEAWTSLPAPPALSSLKGDR